jgi:hypothetical protein
VAKKLAEAPDLPWTANTVWELAYKMGFLKPSTCVFSSSRCNLAWHRLYQFPACRGRRPEYKKAVRRMHHATPDGFAKPLGGEKLDSSKPALRFGGKTAPSRLFRGCAQIRVA